MIQQTIRLNAHASFELYQVRPQTAGERLPLVLVLPGGGYLYISPREGEPVALRLNTHYLHAAVLTYTTARWRDVTLDELMEEVSQTLDWFRDHADACQIDLDRISVMGFSAGGQLAAHCANRLAGRLHKSILAYPATSFPNMEEAAAEETFQRMFARIDEPGLDAVRIRRTMMGLIARDPAEGITARTRPTFVFQTGEDTTVDPLGTLHHCLALKTHGVPFELFYSQKGPHALSLADETCGPRLYRHQAHWFDLAVEWLKDQDDVSLPV